MDGKVTIVDLDGDLDHPAVQELDQCLRDLEQSGQVKIVLNGAKLGQLSPAVSAIFLAQLARIKKLGGDIRLCELSEQNKADMASFRLSKLLMICDTEAEALESFAESKKDAKQEPDSLQLPTEEVGERTVILAPKGAIDRHTIEQLDNKLMSLLDSGRTQIVVDGRELSYISSNGMGVFISFREKVRARDGMLLFFGLQDIVRTVITTLGLHRLFPLLETRDEALDQFENR